MKPIQVFLRTCYHSPNQDLPNRTRPEWFDKDKVYRNFLNTINNELADHTIIYDTHFSPDKGKLATKTLNSLLIDEGTEAGSFLKTLDHVLSLNLPDETIIYFLEDDYLHRPNWCEALIEGLSLADIASLYDHKDKYLHYPDLTSKLLVSDSCHWRTTPSACNTYACKMGTLRADIETHRKHSTNCANGISNDHSKFTELWQRGRTLISAVPGFSTHCDGFVSPVINWEKIINNKTT